MIIYPCHNIRKAIPARDIVLFGVVSKFSLIVAKGFLVSPVTKMSSKLWHLRFTNVKTVYGFRNNLAKPTSLQGEGVTRHENVMA